MTDDLDPFNIAALEKSVNDSAVRVSTIWTSYVIFGLYLAVAVTNVDHRRLLFGEQIKLPVLNTCHLSDFFYWHLHCSSSCMLMF
jgi:hypothetical protein